MNRYIMTDGVKSIDLPQFPNEAWHFYEGEPEEKEDFYAKVSAVYRAVNLTASATANIPFALVKKSGKDFDNSTEWENKVGFMPKPNELIRLWRMSLCMTNKAYGFMENSKAAGKNLRYIVPTTITPIVDINGLQGFKRSIGNATETYPLDKKCPIFWMWRMDHTTELLPAKATEFQAMMSAAGILYYSDSFIQAFFKRGGIKPTMLVLKGMTNKENIDKIESVWDKIIRGGYKYLGKIFQGVDANGGLEAQTIGEGVDNLKDETLTNAKIADIAMSVGMPLSLLLSNSANYATAATEYKSWYENALAPWCSFMAEEMTDKLFKPLNLRFEFRPEMTDPGQEDEVARAGAYSTYVSSGMKPSVAAQVVGIELPEGIEFEALDTMQEEKQQQAIDLMQEKQSSSDKEEKPNAVQEEKEKVKGWVTINGNHVFIEDMEYSVPENATSMPYGKRANFTPETGGILFHGTRAPDDLEYPSGDKDGVLYMTDDYREAKGYAEGVHLGGRGTGTPRVMEISLTPGRMVNIENEIIDALENGDGFKKIFDKARSRGYSYAYYTHPSNVDPNWVQRVIVNLDPYATIGSWEKGWDIERDKIFYRTRNKFIPSIDQLKEMEIWRKFAFRKNKKGEPLDFPFEVKTLPDDIADGIRERLTQAIDEDGIKAAFVIDEEIIEPEVKEPEVKADRAILELADAINKAAELSVLPEVKADPPHFTFNMADMVKINVPEKTDE